MEERHPHQRKLLEGLLFEMKGQEDKYSLGPNTNLKQLKSDGAVLHPINIIRKKFGYADYPEVSFKLPYAVDTSSFRDNSAIECFYADETPIKGVLMGMNGIKGEVRLFAPDFPDWIEKKGVGLKLAPDRRTFDRMQHAIKSLDEPSITKNLFSKIHGSEKFGGKAILSAPIDYRNNKLNQSQQIAVLGLIDNNELAVLHGPPGTGKTTVLVEVIYHKVKKGERVLVTAPSNAAVDHIAACLLTNKLKVLRVGNTLKVSEDIYPYTPEGEMIQSKEYKEIKKLKIKAEELRRMSFQYKRQFGKAEREQRSLLIRESKNIRREIRAIRDYFDQKLYEKADVIIGTPLGLSGFIPESAEFDTLVVDEAGQAIEPLAWVVFPYAKSWILAGDPFQLPPTVISKKASAHGLNISILEKCFVNSRAIYFLDTQYRMRPTIAEFSNRYFYEGQLKNSPKLANTANDLLFYDTAGTGYEEQKGKDGVSLMNEGELSLLLKIIHSEGLKSDRTAVVSPYSGQVQLAKDYLSGEIRTSTIDSFQGQEKEVILLSLVRSNTEGDVGFLKDYRRMNVALTRAKEQLIIVGDSSTIGQEPFYASFLEFVEEVNGYRSAWELME